METKQYKNIVAKTNRVNKVLFYLIYDSILLKGDDYILIEGAFMKIPEVLNFYRDEHYLYESSITHLFSNSLILELNARNIDNPLNKIFFEKRYNPKVNKRCDIYTNFNFLDHNLYNYGYYKENYIEVKFFGNISKKRGSETKSENAGSIICDIYRLIYNTSSIKNKGLYSLIIFDDNPTKYLAFSRADGTTRDWAKNFLKPGVHKLNFDLNREPNTIKNIFKRDCLYNDNLVINTKIRVTTFSPINSNSGYYGSLIQIL